MIENKAQSNESRLRSVGIKTLSCQLDEYIRLVASGETILVTDRDLVVAEIVPRCENRSPVLADALMADAVRSGMLTPPTLSGTGPLAGAETGSTDRQGSTGTRREPTRQVIYLVDISVALAHLLAEDRRPPATFWEENLVSSRLLIYELWTPIHSLLRSPTGRLFAL